MEEYTNEDLQTDINWLNSYGIDRSEAKKFIMSLLKISGKHEDFASEVV